MKSTIFGFKNKRKTCKLRQLLTADACLIFLHQYDGPQVHFCPPKRRASISVEPINIKDTTKINAKELYDEYFAIFDLWMIFQILLFRKYLLYKLMCHIN